MRKTIFAAALAIASAASAAVPFKLGVAGYTFHKRSLDDALAIMRQAGVSRLCVKDFHLPFTATDAEIAAFREKCASYGVEPYGLGPIYCDDAAKVRSHFEFAKRLGVDLVVGVPFEFRETAQPGGKTKRVRIASRKLLLEIDKLVKEFDLKYAIHNHGPQMGELFPDVDSGWELVKDLDPRIGFCIDVGWEYACGKDPAATIRKHASRIYDAHIKNFPKGPKNGSSIPLPRGKLDIASIFKAFADVGYDGTCSLEYEVDFKDNLMAVVECIAYEKGLCDAISGKVRLEPAPAGANTLTEEEKADGWKLLWDGRTSVGWVGVKEGCRKFPGKGWKMEDGVLSMLPQSGISDSGKWFPLPAEDRRLGGGGDIATVAKYRDFALKFDFRLTERANSGVKYFLDETQNKGTCEEYQVLDPGHPDAEKGRGGNRRVAALYDIYPADGADALLKGLGKWNTGMIVARGGKVEHWLNGVKVLEYARGTEKFRGDVGRSKYAKWGVSAAGVPQPWGEIPEGRILLQDHGDSSVSFCNIKIKEY